MADSDPNIPPLPFAESDPLDGSIRNINLPVSQFIYRIKKSLLELKDQIQDKKRDDENRQKILLQEGLRLGPGHLKLLELDSRSNVLPFQERYPVRSYRAPEEGHPRLAQPPACHGEGKSEAEAGPGGCAVYDKFRGIRVILSSDIHSRSKTGARLNVKTF